jgi:hypothetical protein
MLDGAKQDGGNCSQHNFVDACGQRMSHPVAHRVEFQCDFETLVGRCKDSIGIRVQ